MKTYEVFCRRGFSPDAFGSDRLVHEDMKTYEVGGKGEVSHSAPSLATALAVVPDQHDQAHAEEERHAEPERGRIQLVHSRGKLDRHQARHEPANEAKNLKHEHQSKPHARA
ncbi:hypothetical protein ACFQ4Q_22435 [Lysobacter gummosus]|uniref:hypothetical protein n=1 Tax=Lysobacter gummosus TaxID=262324 RepID=UPI0036317ED8